MSAVPKPKIHIINKQQKDTAMYCMKVDTDYKKELCQSVKQNIGMDSLPVTVFNRLISYYLKNQELREAMFLICMANWGTRFGDTVRVRFCHLFDEDGNFKESFMLNGGEEKTGKMNIYYNNAAIQKIVSLYLAKNPKEYYDYLFVSKSNNKSGITLRELEIEERFGIDIRHLQDKIKAISDEKSKLLKLFSTNVITEFELNNELKTLRRNETRLKEDLESVRCKAKEYTSNAPNISIQKPMSRMTADTFIKSALKEIGIIPKNRMNKEDSINISKKFNTHSLRKLFAEQFYSTGLWLNRNGKLNVDMGVLKLTQDKLMHSKTSITRRYNQVEESAFKAICLRMNLGLDVLKKYV